ncbi:hypothetical protein B0H19DRAFT_417850 [Mycena capillaripes]|nr:hypothetical protein B0H19DRAFT_417850 [Mycena capillaripes]
MQQEGSRSISFVKCENCRIKCDGKRPTCGQCSYSSRSEDCEYADDDEPTRTQRLEVQIANVEARIQQLRKPHHLPSPVALQSPYAVSGGPSVQHTRHYSQPSGRATPSRMPSSSSEGIPPDKLDALIHNFLHHGSQFGFFLNVHNFREAAMGRNAQRPATVLLHAVHLWAIHISGSDELTAYEARYLARALRTAVDALSGTHHNTVLHSIQAEVLLASYFFRNTRFLEGKYHLTAAVSLVISSGLHRIRSGASGGSGGPGFRALTPPRDPMEECERISAFWAVLTLNNCWTTADGSSSNISYTDPDARIDTPWPLDINAPGLHHQLLPNSNTGTVNTFLANRPDGGTSVSALHAKGAILFEQATCLASQYHPNMSNKRQFYVSFNSLDTLIERFKLSLPTVQLPTSREMLVIHSLVHVSTIQLHNPFVVDNNASRQRVLDSARAIIAYLGQVPVNEFGYIDPVMGTLWMATCQVFVAELGRVRRHRALNRPAPPEERALTESIEIVLAVMKIFGRNCRLIDSQLSAMHQLYRGP